MNGPAPAVDLLVTGAARVVTMDRERSVLTGAAIALAGGYIAAVGPARSLRVEHRGVPELDVEGGWVLPGMIDGHQHLTGDRLARASIPDDLAPGAAIFSWAVPLHGAHTAADDRVSATLAALEAAANGVTCIVEAGTVAHPESVAAATAAVV